MVRLRFAPSPTGALHIGGARTALFNYLIARNSGGKFILRIDDTDRERSLQAHETDIVECLKWLGLLWDEGPDVGGDHGPYRQSERVHIHLAAAERLLAQDYAYRDHEGVIRLRYPNDEVVVDDLVCGRCTFHPSSLGPEPVIVRSDNTPTYHLASVVDDVEMKITHVIRGQDHLTNTAKHMIICRGLGAEPPQFAHLPLILGEDGTKLSKRNSSGMTTVSEFRSFGYLPEALINFLLLLGWSHPEAKEQLTLHEAVEAFHIDRVGKTASIFETTKLNWLNGWWMRHLPVEDIAPQMLSFLGEYREIVESKGKGFLLETAAFLRSEVGVLSEIPRLMAMTFSLDLNLSEAAEARLVTAEGRAEFLPVVREWLSLLQETPLEDGAERYSKELFSKMISLLKKKVSVPGKVLFHAVRLAITGDVTGPELAAIVPIMPREVLHERAKELLKRLE